MTTEKRWPDKDAVAPKELNADAASTPTRYPTRDPSDADVAPDSPAAPAAKKKRRKKKNRPIEPAPIE